MNILLRQRNINIVSPWSLLLNTSTILRQKEEKIHWSLCVAGAKRIKEKQVQPSTAREQDSSQRQESRTTIQQSETREQDNHTAVKDSQDNSQIQENRTAVKDKRTGQQPKTREQDSSQRHESKTTVRDKTAGQLYSSQRPRSRIPMITIKECSTATSCIQDKSTNHINRCIVVF